MNSRVWLVTGSASGLGRNITEAVLADRLPAHLLVGSDAVEFAGQAERTRAAEAKSWREASISTDFNASGALPAVQF